MLHRNLVIIDCVCVAVIVLALVVKISENQATVAKDSKLPAHINQGSISVDPDFFNVAKGSKSGISDSSVIDKGPVPGVSAKSYLVGNVLTGKIYLEHNSQKVFPVASMSKLVTAIASTDEEVSSTSVEISSSAIESSPEASILSVGEKFTPSELLYPLLLNSSNVAAEALASSTNRGEFLTLMTSYAWEIGMPSTFFADPSGLSPLNMSTSRDFFSLAKYLYVSRSDILSITRTYKSTAATTTDHHYHDFTNIHPFVNSPNFLGGKTGHTDAAKDTMLTIMKISNQPIAIIVLSSENRKSDTELLIQAITKELQ